MKEIVAYLVLFVLFALHVFGINLFVTGVVTALEVVPDVAKSETARAVFGKASNDILLGIVFFVLPLVLAEVWAP